MSDTDNLAQALRKAIDRALRLSDDVVDDRPVPFDDLTMHDRALAAFDAELRLQQLIRARAQNVEKSK